MSELPVPQPASLKSEISSRRTFAIISHPDAGKTTLTEKLLLYSGMVRTAGMVRGRKGAKAASSDWMAMEQERGISITASAMQFRYKENVVNLLDTPGHQDFSEDTYRTLTAADSAVMVIDAAKGVEAQTRKLFTVCRMHKIPILTFINKMDLPAREILDLLHEVEEVLGIKSSPFNWPIGSGKYFMGVVNLSDKKALLFDKTGKTGAEKAIMSEYTFNAWSNGGEDIPHDELQKVKEELELLEIAGNAFDMTSFLKGEITPVFFGSALTNFGIEPFFDYFTNLAPPPKAYTAISTSNTITKNKKSLSSQGDAAEITFSIPPATTYFSAYVFKIQANMNPKHRDSMAFLRVTSGVFERDSTVYHYRLGKEVRLSRSYAMVAKERDTVNAAFAGDIIGVINPGVFLIGDTISSPDFMIAPPLNEALLEHHQELLIKSGEFHFLPMPQFPPEVVATVRPTDVMKLKSFEKGLKQLSEEGAVQILRSYKSPASSPYVAAVGKLQFDVLQYRLKSEYNVDVYIDYLPYRYSSYLSGDPGTIKLTGGSTLALDIQNRVVFLCTNEWEKKFVLENNKSHSLSDFL
jgi:peptide chain release factor 3